MVRLLLAMRAGRTQTPDRSGNCSSLATENADGSSYQRTGANRTQGRHDLVRVLPVGGMPPTGNLVAPTLVGNHAGDYYTPKIQGLPLFTPNPFWGEVAASFCRVVIPSQLALILRLGITTRDRSVWSNVVVNNWTSVTRPWTPSNSMYSPTLNGL